MTTPAINPETLKAPAAAADNNGGKMGRKMLWMVWSGVVSIANSILLWVFIARWREPEELGRFTVVMGLYALFYGVCSLGLMTYLVTEISRLTASSDNSALPGAENKRSVAEFISSAGVFLSISGAACAVLMGASVFLISESWEVRLSTLILSVSLIPTGAVAAAESIAVSFGRTRLIALVSTLENLLRTVVPLALIWLGFDMAAICLSFVAVRLVALLAYFWAGRSWLASFAFSKTDFVKLLKVSPTFAGTIILASLNWQVVIILLSRLSTETESARYGVASRFLVPVSILMASYANVLQPVITQYFEKSIGSAGAYLTKMVGYPLILAAAAAVLAPFLSVYVLTALFGEAYADVSLTLDTLALAVIPFCVVMIVSRGLVAAKSQHIDLYANAFGVAACVLVGWLLIPKFGAVGAAVAQLASFFLMALLETVYLSKKIIKFHLLQKALVPSLFLLAIHLIIWKL